MGRTLEEATAGMPPESQARVPERSAKLHAEVEGLKALLLAPTARGDLAVPARGGRRRRRPDEIARAKALAKEI